MNITHKVITVKNGKRTETDCYSLQHATSTAEKAKQGASVVTILTDAGIKDRVNHGVFVLDRIVK